MPRRWLVLPAALLLVSGCRKESDGAPSVPVSPEEAERAAAEPQAGSADEIDAPAQPDPEAVREPVHPASAAPSAPDGGPEAVAVNEQPAADGAGAPRVASIVVGDGEMEIGRPEIARGGGRFSGSLLLRAIERKRGGMLACYNMQLGSDPSLQGDVTVVLVIDTQGMVGVRVETDDPDLAAAGVTSCVVGKLRTVTFDDHPPSSDLWIRMPLHFEP